MLAVVPDLPAVLPADGASPSLIDQIVREGARQMLAAALQAEVAAYIEQFADVRGEDGRPMVVRNGSRRAPDGADQRGRGRCGRTAGERQVCADGRKELAALSFVASAARSPAAVRYRVDAGPGIRSSCWSSGEVSRMTLPMADLLTSPRASARTSSVHGLLW
jgi:hypothetical protein